MKKKLDQGITDKVQVYGQTWNDLEKGEGFAGPILQVNYRNICLFLWLIFGQVEQILTCFCQTKRITDSKSDIQI